MNSPPKWSIPPFLKQVKHLQVYLLWWRHTEPKHRFVLICSWLSVCGGLYNLMETQCHSRHYTFIINTTKSPILSTKYQSILISGFCINKMSQNVKGAIFFFCHNKRLHNKSISRESAPKLWYCGVPLWGRGRLRRGHRDVSAHCCPPWPRRTWRRLFFRLHRPRL